MTYEKYKQIILSLCSMSNFNSKKSFLLENIEKCDYDRNGFNDDLINLYNRMP